MIDLILGNSTALILLAVLGVGFVGVIWWKGADWQAQRAQRRDQENADRIADSVSRARHDPDKLREMDQRGYRD